MMRQTKRALAVLLAVLLIALTVPVSFAAVLDSGTCGDNLTWKYEGDRTLTISGTGEMDSSYDDLGNRPWDGYAEYTKKIVIEPGVTSISDGAFVTFDVLESVTIPDTVETVGSAFAYCSKLTEIEIPDSVTKISESAFQCCHALSQFKVSPYNPIYCNDDAGCLYNKEKTNLIQYPIGRTETSFTVPSTVDTISQTAFMDSVLTEITVPTSVYFISENAFEGSVALTDVFFTGTQAQWEKRFDEDHDPFEILNENGLKMHYSAAVETPTDATTETPTDATNEPSTEAPSTTESTTSAPTTTKPAADSKKTAGSIIDRFKDEPLLLIFAGVIVVLLVLIVVLLILLLRKNRKQLQDEEPEPEDVYELPPDETVVPAPLERPAPSQAPKPYPPQQYRPAQPQNPQAYPPQQYRPAQSQNPQAYPPQQYRPVQPQNPQGYPQQQPRPYPPQNPQGTPPQNPNQQNPNQ